MKAAVLDARVFDARDKKVISFFCLFSDGFPARSVMLANRDVDRRRLFFAALRKLGVLGGRLERFLDAITGFLLLLFAALAGLVPPRQRRAREREAAVSCQESRQTRRELAVRTLVDCEQQAFEIGNEAPRLVLLALQPLLLRLAQRHAPQGPAQHRR